MVVPQTEVILSQDDAGLARMTLPPGEYVIGRATSSLVCAPQFRLPLHAAFERERVLLPND